MPASDIIEWLDEFGGAQHVWYVKRLSGNDTLANGSHQAGPYIPKDFLFRVLPGLNRQEIKNPDVLFDLYVDSHADCRQVRAIWYNNRFHGNPKGGRNEARVTGFGGNASALLDPESTGALTVFVFRNFDQGGPPDCHVWVCRDEAEEDLIEDRVGPVEPGKWLTWPPQEAVRPPAQVIVRTSCWLDASEIPTEWLTRFPSGADIIRKSIELRDERRLDPDRRLLRRRECEFEIFRSVEQAIEMPYIAAGFPDIDRFIARAQTILQRRKARSGHSLELHAKAIFEEEQLVEGLHFAHQPESDPGKKPDFLFPSAMAYKDQAYPTDCLRMLAVKTTCRDRWRQILNEADRISVKHLLTLQEGVSEAQFGEMHRAGVKLVVPDGIKEKFPKSVQPHLQSLGSFISEIQRISFNK